ncbi:PDZ and LIM domain protein Zasp-like [Uloborus diversus]|uniref:PDZ and LIM domain protein Zasp-like n=1 Tax=Uloborus diversus TaxID=327109 RepID=UPI00240A2C16|nr:PDZ and LIM domain protein Zasp-like [Uloborus diversus]
MASLASETKMMETFSMNVISQTLTPHIETIAPGVMGINFMRPEKPINTMSEVYKLVQEQEQSKVKSPIPGAGTTSPIFKPSKIPPTVPAKPKTPPAVNHSVPFAPPKPAPPPQTDGPTHGPCSDCGRMIIGQFVSLSDRTLHEECFKCSTCGASLKNIGFHNINNKLYCEMHARLAARVIAGSATGVPAAPAAPAASSYVPPPLPKSTQAPPAVAPKVAAAPKPAVAPPVAPSFTPSSAPSLTPQPPTVPSLPPSNVPQTVPTPFGQNLANLPLTPSSSGGLAFRSISPQPFKRISGEFHKVVAPSSPTPGSTSSAPLAYASGPLPFEMKPYMPPDTPRSSLFSSVSESSIASMTDFSQSSQVSQEMQIVQRTTQVTQQMTQQVSQSSQQHILQSSQQQSQSSHSNFPVDYKQVAGQPKTKFVWPPPKAQFEMDGSLVASQPPAQNYSPLVTQSTPAPAPSFHSVQPPVPHQQMQEQAPQQQEESVPAPIPPSAFSVPSVPTTFSAQPAKVDDAPAPAPELMKEEIQAPQAPPAPPVQQAPPAPSMPSIPQAQNFAPVLPPVVDLKPTPTPAQPGVPTGAGSKPAPKKGRGQLMNELTPGRIPICADCGEPIRGPFIVALNRTWCPDHFHCNNLHCKTNLIDIGFVEEQGQLYCENCYEAYLAPICNKCNVRIKGDCLNAVDKQWHPQCFICAYCSKPFGNNSFYLEDGLPYCEKDWNELFTTKCIACGFPIEAGDRWVEALNNNYHSQCFKCSICNKNLEGQSFYAKGGKPFCKQHARL